MKKSHDEIRALCGEPSNPVLAALDALAIALADHEHEWTEREAVLYEQAVFAAGGGYTARPNT